jgi:hypothetical protein
MSHTLSAPWAGFKPLTSEMTFPALFVFRWKEKNIHRYIIVVSRGLDEKQLWSSLKHCIIRLDGVD